MPRDFLRNASIFYVQLNKAISRETREKSLHHACHLWTQHPHAVRPAVVWKAMLSADALPENLLL